MWMETACQASTYSSLAEWLAELKLDVKWSVNLILKLYLQLVENLNLVS